MTHPRNVIQIKSACLSRKNPALNKCVFIFLAKSQDQPTNLWVQPAICSNITDQAQQKTLNPTLSCVRPQRDHLELQISNQNDPQQLQCQHRDQKDRQGPSLSNTCIEHRQTDLVRNTLGYGSQCKSIRTGAIWSNRPRPRINSCSWLCACQSLWSVAVSVFVSVTVSMTVSFHRVRVRLYTSESVHKDVYMVVSVTMFVSVTVSVSLAVA